MAKNVSFAATAQQAIAKGFRPCLRCRPDSAPQSFAWQGVNTTIHRAMKLLSEKLDESIETTSMRLGISARYLNKLFDEHLGVSPKRYKLYQQLLLAKKLLQETSMSIDLVAHNVGFNSARQLQYHVKNHLKLKPSDIRKQARVNQENKMNFVENVSIELPYRPPYDWPLVRDFLSSL